MQNNTKHGGRFMADERRIEEIKNQVRAWMEEFDIPSVVTWVKEVTREPSLAKKNAREEFRKCGKANCRCARGELHGPYLYLQYREGGKVKRQYLGLGKPKV